MPISHRQLAFFVLSAWTMISTIEAQCQVTKLAGPHPSPSHSQFGASVALWGDRMIIGDKGLLAKFPAGSAEIFERSQVGGWVSAGVVTSSDGEDFDLFGYSVTIAGDTLVAGAPATGSLGAKGTAYVFERQLDGSWLETQKLFAPETSAWGYGWAADIDGDRFVVGAKGASTFGGGRGWVFVYEREAGVWVHKASIQPSGSAPGDVFGSSLDLEGERLAVGAPFGESGGEPTGQAYVFEREPSGTSWTEVAKFHPDDLGEFDQFGQDVALHGDRVVAGAPVHDLPTIAAGAVYVFDLDAGVWSQTAKLTLKDAPLLSDFGWAVDVEGERVIVGAYADSFAASGGGSAHIFEEIGGVWIKGPEFSGSGISQNDTFGYSVDLEGSELLVGAPGVIGGAGTGLAYLFELDNPGASLIPLSESVSLSQGGTQSLQLGACADHAGDLYVLAGTATGTAPGFAFAGLPVPLNPDAYFLHTVHHVGAPPLVDGIGTLDSHGFAEASFTVAPGTTPGLAGLVLHHAYAVLDAGTLQLLAVSGAAPVALEP